MNNNEFFGGNRPNARQAVYFIEEGKGWGVNPIYNLDETPNTPDRFVIVKTTANGKFLIGDQIHYKFNGIDIITDSENAIFVDTVNNTVFIRDYGRALREIAPEDPEQRQYLLVLVNPEDCDLNDWVTITGRTSAYNYIKNFINLIDPKRSIVLTENVTLKDALTVSQFVTYLKNSDIIHDDFNIEDYEEEEVI